MTILLSRRRFLRTAASGLVAASVRPGIALESRSGPVRIGAIRWDAWYDPDSAPGSSEWFAAHNLDPAQYHRRAPFFAERVAPDRMIINGTQASMDAEIVEAWNAGLSYWAFGWYQQGRPFRKAWDYYQASTHNRLVNWCILIGMNSLGSRFPPHDELLSYLAQPNYEAYGTRPVLFVMHERGASLQAAAASLSLLRARCVERGLGSPYVVVQCPIASLGADEMVGIGADAISAYAFAPPIQGGPRPYAELDRAVRSFWSAMAATGARVVPNAMSGWDRRPRIERPPPFNRSVADLPGGLSNYYHAPSTAEFAAHLRAMIDFVGSHRRACEAGLAMVYSWNECDEGGNVLCPTWTPDGPDRSRLDALRTALASSPSANVQAR